MFPFGHLSPCMCLLLPSSADARSTNLPLQALKPWSRVHGGCTCVFFSSLVQSAYSDISLLCTVNVGGFTSSGKFILMKWSKCMASFNFKKLVHMTFHINSLPFWISGCQTHPSSSALSGTCSFRFGQLIGGLLGCFCRVGSVVGLGMDVLRLVPCSNATQRRFIMMLSVQATLSSLLANKGWDMLSLSVHAHMTCPSELYLVIQPPLLSFILMHYTPPGSRRIRACATSRCIHFYER